MSHEWKKGQVGYYRAMQGNGPVVRAIVRRVHRDGTVTVESPVERRKRRPFRLLPRLQIPV
jgi:hypothetical protein